MSAPGPIELITPDWPAPTAVRAYATTRAGGVSEGRFASLNLADHVGDRPEAVAENRRRLCARLHLPAEPVWLVQVHGSAVARLEPGTGRAPVADAALARIPGRVCAVLTADCLPVLLCARDARAVAAIHAGWRGLAGGVIERCVAELAVPPEHLLAWIGPGVGGDAYEVGPEVRAALLGPGEGYARAFRPSPRGGWLADLAAVARARLGDAGVGEIYGGGWCTASEPARFFSHRRDGVTGRMAALIWLGGGPPPGSG